MKRVLLTIEYDGSGFKGFQSQQNQRTVQGELEAAIEKVCGKHIEVFASGRTDAGVHALGQTAHFDLNVPLPISKLADVLNSLLPPDITIKSAQYVDSNFHARFDIKSKCYMYKLYTGSAKHTFQSRYEGSISYPLDVALMKKASKMFLGEHDFRGYCSSAAVTSDYRRTIFNFSVKQEGDYIYFEIEGSGFLYNMVRIIVGTLVDIGRGKLSIESAQRALDEGDRSLAGVTMEPNGLYLKWTKY